VTEPSTPAPAPLPSALIEALDEARTWGFLGDGALDVHVAHAQGFADAAEALLSLGERSTTGSESEGIEPGPWMDLGSGGGIPGLVLAHRWNHRQAVLLDSNERRARFLSHTVDTLGWQGRVQVVSARAEQAGRDDALRGRFSLVVARSFASPPVTAECAAPFLRIGGILIVSEPPVAPGAQIDERWPEEPLATLGLESAGLRRAAFGYRMLRQARACPDRFPRRVGVPSKRPLYRPGGP
jgi:16S rRNA (guanine527-N7)-methyltransferase